MYNNNFLKLKLINNLIVHMTRDVAVIKIMI